MTPTPRRLAVIALALGLLAGCRKDTAVDHLERARTALYEKRPEDALAEYKQAIDLLDRDPSSEVPVYRARALRGAADVYYLELRDYRRAVEVYRELIHLCPEAAETAEGRVALATLLQREFHDPRGAIAELKAALNRNPPQGAELSYRVASLYFELQDYKQCEIEAAALAHKYENSPLLDKALFLRGQALAMMDGRKPDAQRAFMDLVDRYGDSPLKAHALYELGRLKAEQGEGERAIELWAEALKTHPHPEAVQSAIAKVRRHLRATTPDTVGDASKAFDWNVPGNMVIEKPAKTSAEAVGGTSEEARREAAGRIDAAPLPAGAPAPPAPTPESPP